MKHILLLSSLILWWRIATPQAVEFQAGFGATIVDVKKVIGKELSDYNTYSYEFILQGLIKSHQDRLKWLPEIGIHRLYYWEEQYTVYVPTASPRWRWGTIWTAHAGFGIERSLLSYGYVQTGVNMRYFLDGSGVTPGIMGGIGLKYHISNKLVLPLGLRVDVVFGKATPSALCVCTGIQFGKAER